MDSDELKFWKLWIKGPYPWLGSWRTCRDAAISNTTPEISSRKVEITEFHEGKEDWEKAWKSKVVGRTCVDVGCGCDGFVPFWKSAGKRILVDPLVEEYQKLILEESERMGCPGFSWFDGCEMIPRRATEVNLEGDVIVFRNALDHDDDPVSLLHAALRMGRKGARLYFWSELTHHERRNDGHHEVPLTATQIIDQVRNKGWKIIRRFKAVSGPGYQMGEELGFVADKA